VLHSYPPDRDEVVPHQLPVADVRLGKLAVNPRLELALPERLEEDEPALKNMRTHVYLGL
jgi:hypothetical protein